MKNNRFLKVIIFLSLPFLIYWTNWWLEDIAIRKEGLDRIVELLNQQKLKEAEIVYFSGTHKGKERDAAGRHYIFYSPTEIQFPSLKGYITKKAQNYPDKEFVLIRTSYLKRKVGHDVGKILDMQLYSKDISPGRHGIQIWVTKTSKGFYYDIRHAWAV